jgi:hypothetical protein
MTADPIRSMDDFERRYLPERWRRKHPETPQELGERIAREAIEASVRNVEDRQP